MHPDLPPHGPLWLQTLQWQPQPHQLQQFQGLYQGILDGNQRCNLTRITDPEDFWEKHIWDSLAGLQGLDLPALAATDDPQRVIDIGTGGGFPGLPLAIAFPHWSVTLLDSTAKKINYLRELAQNLELTGVKTLINRAEATGKNPQHREQYHLATVRAVGETNVCAEYALPLVKIGGVAVLYRGRWDAAETPSLRAAARQLGGELEKVIPFRTPLSDGDRTCIYLRKIHHTPKDFPRAIGVPKQKPLRP